MKKISTRSYIIIGFLVALSFVGYFVWATYRNMRQTETESRNVKSALQTLLLLESTLNDMQELESGQRGYLISGKENFLNAYNESLAQVAADTSAINQLDQNDSIDQHEIVHLQSLIRDKISFSEHVISTRNTIGYDSAAYMVQTERGKKLMDSIRKVIFTLEDEDRTLLQQSNKLRSQTASQTAREFFIMAAAFFLILIACFLIIDRNIKKRSRAEDMLRYNASLVENVSDAIFSVDPYFVIRSWNKGAEHIYGWSAEEAIGKHAEILLHTIHQGAPLQELMQQFETDGFINTEVVQQNKAGDKLHVLVSSSAIFDENGTITGAVVVNRDVTEAKKAAQQINYLAGLVAQSGDAIISTDLNFTIHSWNKGAEEMYGYTEDEALHENFLDLLQTQRTQQQRDQVIGVLIQSGYFMEELVYMKKNGDPITVQASYSVMRNERHEISGCVVVHRDITERKRLEERIAYLANLLEQTNEAIYSMDSEGTVISWNKGAEQIYLVPRKEAIGKPVGDLTGFHPTDEQVNEIMNEIEKSGSWSIERSIRDENGAQRYLAISLTKMRSGNDEPGGYVAVAKDITDIRKLREQLQQFNEELEEQVKLKTTQLRKSEEKYRSMIEQATDGIIIYSFDGVIHEFNTSAYQLAGYTRQEFEQKSVLDLLYEKEMVVNPAVYEKILSGKPALFNRKFLKKDGSVVEMELSAVLLADGKVLAFIRDISERKMIEARIMESEERYRTLVEQASDGIFISDTSGNYIEVNDSACKLLGYSREELLTMSGRDILSDPADVDRLAERYQELRMGKSFTSERELKRKDGSIIFVETNGKMLHDGRFMGILRDITERKKVAEKLRYASERYREIVKATNDGLWEMELPSRESWWSDALYKISGVDASLDSTEMAWLSKVHPGDRDRVLGNLDQVIDNKETEWSIEYRMLPREDTELIVLDRGFVIYDEQQQPIRVFGSVTDITERKRIENEIRKSEENYRTIIEQASDGIFIIDRDVQLVEINTAGCRMLGYTKEEMLQLHYTDVIPPEELEHNPLKLGNIGRGNSVINERRMIRKDGSEIIVEISAKMLSDGRFQAIARDVTQRKAVEMELVRSQEKYVSLMNTIDGIVWEADAQTFVFNFVSKQAERLLGYPTERWTDDPNFWADHIHPEDRGWAVQYCMSSTRDKKAHEFEYRMIAEDGRIIWVQDIVTVILENNQPSRLRGIMVDITERKKAEAEVQKVNELFNLVTKATSDIVWDLNLDNYRLWWNDNFYTLLGYPPSDEGTHFNDWVNGIHEEEREEVVKDILEAINSGGDQWAQEYRFRKADGSFVNIYDRGYIMHDPSGKAYRMIGSMIDITEMKKAEEKLQQSYREIRALASNLERIREEERTNISREIHDELGQQLTGFKMDLYWLNRRIKNEEPEIKQKMQASLLLVDETIKTVRKIATELRPSILDDLGLVAALEWQSEEFEKRYGIAVNFVGAMEGQMLSSSVSTALFRIYQELLTNVARHSRAGVVEASMYVDHNHLYLTVTDNGSGFEVSNISSKKTLGLLGIKERTFLLGGQYEIRSKPGEGTTVVISVPLAENNEPFKT